MQINKKYEQILINIGIETLLERAASTYNLPKKRKKSAKRKKNGHKWSRTQRSKFLKTMRSKWNEKRKERLAS